MDDPFGEMAMTSRSKAFQRGKQVVIPVLHRYTGGLSELNGTRFESSLW